MSNVLPGHLNPTYSGSILKRPLSDQVNSPVFIGDSNYTIQSGSNSGVDKENDIAKNKSDKKDKGRASVAILETAKTIILALVAALVGVCVWEFQGVKTDLSNLRTDVANQHVEFITKIDGIDKNVAVVVQRLDDLRRK